MTSVKALFFVFLIATGLVAAPAAQANWGQSMSNCSASTQCGYYARDAWGRIYFVPTHTINCFVYANASAGTACTWEWAFNSYVRCTGVDAYGRWGQLYYTCH
jgi:hypothetical protein